MKVEAYVFAIAKRAGFIGPEGSKKINTTTKGFVLNMSFASKLRKYLVAAISGALALSTISAMPASAAGYAAENAFAYRSASVSISGKATEVMIPAGATGVNFDLEYVLGANFFTNNAGKTITFTTSVTGPDGKVLGSGYYVGNNPNFRFCSSNNQCDFNTWDKKELLVKNTHTSGSVSGYTYVNRQGDMSNMMAMPEPLTPGKYTISAKIQADGVDVVVDEVQNNIVTGRSSISYNLSGASVTPAAGAGSMNFSAHMCVDSAKLQVGDVVTPEIYVNDEKKSTNTGMTYYYTRDGLAPNPRMGGVSPTATVTQDDIDFGLAVSLSVYSGSVTAGSTYALSGKLLDQDGNEVSGDCAPGAAAKPTLTVQGQNLTVTPGVSKFSDMSLCEFYASTDLTKVLRTVMSMSMGPNMPETCTYNSAPPGSYVVKTTGYYSQVPGAKSEASNAVVISAPGYTVNPAVSGGDNGGQVSVVSNSTNTISGANSVRFTADPTGALRLSIVSENPPCPPCGASSYTATLEKTTTSGLSSTFAGTGSATLSAAGGGFPSATWYGAGDKWTIAGANLTFSGNESTYTYKVRQGTYGAAAATSLEIASSVFEATCSTLGAGYTAKPTSQSTGIAINPVSAPTAKQLYFLQCYKPTTLISTSSNLANPVLVTIDNATTVSVVKVLGENSNIANDSRVAVSASTAATGSATALTIFVTKRLLTDITMVNNMTTESGSIAGREIVRLAADLTSTTTTSGWVTSGTTLANEPAVIVPQVNDGSLYAMLRVASDLKLMKVSATGAASAAVSITNDKVADMANFNLSWPTGLQSGSLANVSLLASTATKSTVLSVNTATGAGKASEIISYVVSQGIGLVNATVVDPATKDVYWWFSNTAADAGKMSVYKWRDPMYVKPVGPVPAVTSKNLEYATNTPAAGTKVTFTGTNLDLATAVKFGTAAATLGTKTATSLEVTVPAGTGTVAITIESANGNVAGGDFTYVGADKVAQTVTLDAGANTATVGDADRTLSATVAMTGYTAVASLTYSSTTAAVCTVTGTKLKFVAKGTCTVKATQAGSSWTAEGVATKDITVVGSAPVVSTQVTGKATNTPAAGTKVTIAGSNLGEVDSVKFGAVTATIGTRSATSLEVTVPAGTKGTVDINLLYSAGTVKAGTFEYVGADKIAQTVTLDAGANTATVGDADRTLSATVAMTGYTAVPSLTYSSTTAAVCTVTGNKLKFVAKGTCTVKATQAGSSWTAEGVATKDITVAGPDPQTITIKAPSAGEKLVGPDGFFVYPSTNSGLPLSIRFDTPSVCKKGTFAANHVINLKTGTCKVTVSAGGNAQWSAGSSTLTYTVGKAGTTEITDAGNVDAPVILNGNGAKTNVLSEVVSWKKSTGALTVSSRGVWVGPITATATFKIGSKNYTCSLKYGTQKAAAATSVKGFPAGTALCGGSSATDKAALAALKSITTPVTVKIVVVRELRDPAKYATKGQKVTRSIYLTIG